MADIPGIGNRSHLCDDMSQKAKTSIGLLCWGFHNLEKIVTNIETCSNRSGDTYSILFPKDMRLGCWELNIIVMFLFHALKKLKGSFWKG